MAKGATATLAVSIIAKTKKFKKGMKGAAKSITEFATKIRKLTILVVKYGVAMAAAAAAGIALFVRQQLRAVDALAKVSQKIGLSSQALAGLRFAAKQTGVEVATLDMALQRMARRISEAAVGTGEAKAAIAELGIDARKIAELDVDQQFTAIAEAMENVRGEGNKLRLMFKLFDSEGVALKNTVALGAKGLAEMRAQAEKFGLTLSNEAVAGVEEANNSVNRLTAAFIGMGRQLTGAVAPILSGVADTLSSMFGGGDGESLSDKIKNSTDLMVIAFGAVADAVGEIVDKMANLMAFAIALPKLLAVSAGASKSSFDAGVSGLIAKGASALGFNDTTKLFEATRESFLEERRDSDLEVRGILDELARNQTTFGSDFAKRITDNITKAGKAARESAREKPGSALGGLFAAGKALVGRFTKGVEAASKKRATTKAVKDMQGFVARSPKLLALVAAGVLVAGKVLPGATGTSAGVGPTFAGGREVDLRNTAFGPGLFNAPKEKEQSVHDSKLLGRITAYLDEKFDEGKAFLGEVGLGAVIT